jgi:hypothetical protein
MLSEQQAGRHGGGVPMTSPSCLKVRIYSHIHDLSLVSARSTECANKFAPAVAVAAVAIAR